MSADAVYSVWGFQDQDLTATARVRNAAGQYVTQASLSSIAYAVYDRDNNDTLVTSGSVTVSTSVFDTLQNAAADLVLWVRGDTQIDSVGWNFKHTLPRACFPLGKTAVNAFRRYRVEYTFTPQTGDPFRVFFDVKARDVLGVAG